MKRRSFLCLYSLFMLCIIELGRLFSVLMNYGFVINSTFSLLMWCLFKREKFCANWFSNTWIFISKIFKSAVWRNVLGESNNLSVNQFSVLKTLYMHVLFSISSVWYKLLKIRLFYYVYLNAQPIWVWVCWNNIYWHYIQIFTLKFPLFNTVYFDINQYTELKFIQVMYTWYIVHSLGSDFFYAELYFGFQV